MTVRQRPFGPPPEYQTADCDGLLACLLARFAAASGRDPGLGRATRQ